MDGADFYSYLLFWVFGYPLVYLFLLVCSSGYFQLIRFSKGLCFRVNLVFLSTMASIYYTGFLLILPEFFMLYDMFLVFGHLVVIWTYHLCNCYIYVDIFSLMAFTCVWISLRLPGSMNQVAHIYFLFVPVDGYFEIKVGYYFHMSSEILVHHD